uniref:ATP-dependent sacrificial sulfur transferase LarE n=1 Tax=Paractinoplanes polyasparticus TaxID=2856853 RepID=UPI0027E20D9E|nr:ATP-dependent sacrificial sulfur transferase LarE [Actinoplanes polyasparticus]
MTSVGTDETALATERVAEQLRGVGRLGVAFSGGVDSSVLLALAVGALGADRVVAVLGVSPSLAADERAAAHRVARRIGAVVVEVETREGEREAYRANGPDRCFHCKDELFTRIGADVAQRHRLDAVAYGENADDVRRPDRPGARAAAEHRVLTPLAVAGLDKAAVRRIARALDLPCADKPAAPCLASRIPHHQIVSPRKLGQVERAEAALRRLGFGDLRVRHHGDIARIELPAGDLVRAASEPLRELVHRAVIEAGFRFVTLDLAGIQSGAFTGAYLREDQPSPSARPETKPTARPETKPTAGPETKPTARPETKPTAGPETKPTARPETKPTAGPEVKSTRRPETEPDARMETKPDATPETRPEAEPARTEPEAEAEPAR